MSLHALNCALRCSGLTPTKKLVLVVLANYADETGSCYPSHKHIAEIVGLKDHKGVQKIIKGFEESELLRVEKRYNGSGGQTSNRYHLNLTKMVLEDISKSNLSPLRAETPPPTAEETPNTKDKPKDDRYTREFEEFWAIYPRKVSKFGASKAFKRLSKSDNLAARVAVKNFAKLCAENKTEEQFIPHAQTWLNNRRYDEYLQPAERPTRTTNQIAG